MNLAGAIRARYGIRLPPMLGEFHIRRFRIDQFRNGFVIPVGKGGIFGCVIDAEAYLFDGETVELFRLGHRENKQIQFEWLVWNAGKSMIEKGEVMSEKDENRLALAIERLEGWL